jgi:hypothetical protein
MGAILGLLVGMVGGATFIQLVFASDSSSSRQLLVSLLVVVPITTVLGAVIGLLWSRR